MAFRLGEQVCSPLRSTLPKQVDLRGRKQAGEIIMLQSPIRCNIIAIFPHPVQHCPTKHCASIAILYQGAAA